MHVSRVKRIRKRAEQDLLERAEMRIFIWIMGTRMIEKFRTDRRNKSKSISEKIREARLRQLRHKERKTEEDIVIRTWETQR